MSWTPPEVVPEEELRDCAPVDHWRAAMETIALRHGLSAGGLEPYAAGSDVVFGGEGFVIKLTDPRWAKLFPAERYFLEHLEGKLSIEVPRILAAGELEGWPYFVMTRLDDVELGEVWPKLDHEARLSLAGRIGEMTAELHALAPPEPLVDWDEFVARRREVAVAHHRRRGVSETWQARIEPFLDATPRPAHPAVLLHTELLPAHILVACRDDEWRPSGLIDFMDSKVGDPDYEFAALVEFVFQAEAGCLRRCLEGYGGDAAELTRETGRRLAAWGLLHEFADLARALRAAGEPEPADFEAIVDRLYDLGASR